MRLARDDLVRRALDRVRGLSASKLIEPAPAYEVFDRGDHVRLVSGADALEPGMVWMDGADNVLITGFNAKVRRHCAFRVRGRGNVIFFGAYSQVASTNVVIEGNDNLVSFGAFATSSSSAFRIAGDGEHILVGDRCMFSSRITVGDADPLVIYDRKTGRRVDQRRNVVIGDHTWLAREVRVEPGAVIGADTIVGQGAVVTGVHPANVILAGAPSTVRTSGVNWSRNEDESLDAMEASTHYKILYLAARDAVVARIAGLGGAARDESKAV